MTHVRILHAGGVGEHRQGDVVKDAPVGLVEIAEREIRNVADGELVAEIVEIDDDGNDEVSQLRAYAKELGIKSYHVMKPENLKAAVESEVATRKAAEEEEARKADEVEAENARIAEEARLAEEETARKAAEELASKAGQ